MTANKNTSVCVATSPGPLIEMDANRTAAKPPRLRNRAARTSYVRRSSARRNRAPGHAAPRGGTRAPRTVRQKGFYGGSRVKSISFLAASVMLPDSDG
jgi:hypothetical protein